MEYSVENMCGFLIRSKLMTPEQMRGMHQRWQGEAKDGAGDRRAFLRWLVSAEYLTEYQAQLLGKGHADPADFFLNHYRILDRLGRGRMAGVYKAIHSLGQVVAIKVLPPSRSKNPQLLGRFQREAKLALKLRHPNVVRSFQVGEANGLHYLVMEYLEGETLEDVLARRKRLPPNEAVRLIHQALQGLQHVSESGMVHRDLKPSNLMLTPATGKGEPDTTAKATVKILDIGLGRPIEEGVLSSDNLNLTSEGMLLGTPDYLAPEQARDARATDIRADIYSMGCVLYHAISGQPPFPDKNLLNQLVRHATETPRPLKEFNPAVPDGLQQIVNYMMAKTPEQRYPTPDRAASALQMFLMADSVAPKPLEEPPLLRKFLTQLALDVPGDPASVAPLATAVPAAAPVAATAAPVATAVPVQARPAQGIPAQGLPVQGGALPGVPVAAAVPGGKVAEEAGKSRRHRHRERQRGKVEGSPVPTAQPHQPPPGGVQEFDVELIPLSEAAEMQGKKSLWSNLSPSGFRDWVLVGYGAGTVMFLVAFVWLLISIFGGSGEAAPVE